MIKFYDEMEDRLQLLMANQWELHKTRLKIYFRSREIYLPDYFTEMPITDIQFAFLDLWRERHAKLALKYSRVLSNKLKAFYRNDPDSQQMSMDNNCLSIHSITFPDADGAWEMAYEINFDDTIFHVDFKEWDFVRIGITH